MCNSALTNIRLGWKFSSVTNTLALSASVLIAVIKSFIASDKHTSLPQCAERFIAKVQTFSAKSLSVRALKCD